MGARFVFDDCLEASQRCSDDFKMDAFKSENGSEIGTSSSSVTDEFADASRRKNRKKDFIVLEYFWGRF